MKKLFVLLIMALVIPASAPALEAPVEEEECAFVDFFTDTVPFFVTEVVPAGASAAWDGTKYHTAVAAVSVAVFAKSAGAAVKNVTVGTVVAIRDTAVEVTEPLLW
jgi:hypothetical protein